jgi:hypothetical protein
MGVDLRWENENGSRIDEIPDPQMYISHLVLQTDLTGTTCLRFIDPYGDTTFNRLQIPTLIEELKAVLHNVPDNGMRDHLRRVIELAEKSRDEIHTYLKFYGD